MNKTRASEARRTDESSWNSARTAAVVTGVFCVLWGSVHNLGWHLRLDGLLQWRPGLAPIQYNTTLLFLCLGAAFLALAWERRLVLGTAAGFAWIMSFLTIVEYGTSWNLGIDELFNTAYISVKTSHPGRMAPNTSIAFFFASLALILTGYKPLRRHGNLILTLGGLVVFAISTIGLLGYFSRLEGFYGWGSSTRMANPTTWGLAGMSIGMVWMGAVSVQSRPASVKALRKMILAYSSLGVLLLVLIAASVGIVPLHQQLEHQEKQHLLSVSHAKILEFAQFLETAKRTAELISSRTRAEDLLAGFMENTVPEQEFKEQTIEILQDAIDVTDELRTLIRVSVSGEALVVVGDTIPQEFWPVGLAQSQTFKVRLDQANGLQTLLILSSPITREGKRIGSDLLFIEPYPLRKSLQEKLGFSRNHETYLGWTDGNQMEYYHWEPEWNRIAKVDISPVLKTALASIGPSGPNVFEVNDPDLGWEYVAFSRLEGTPWSALVVSQSGELLSALGHQLQLVFLGIFVFSLGGSLAMYFLMKPLGKGFLVYVDAMDQRIRDVSRTNQQLAKQNTELEQFAYVASHDLKEPLRKISFFANLLSKSSSESLDEKNRDYLKRMISASERMGRLIEELLSLSRITTRFHAEKRVDLERVMFAVTGDLELESRNAGALIEVGSLPTVQADSTQMYQLFKNLIANALKFRHPDRALRIGVHCTLMDEGRVQVRVSDNGIGFDSRYAETVFQPFKRLNPPGKFEGSGIGLAICRKVVERHGGEIWVETTPGQGSTFFVSLPLFQSEMRRPEAPSNERKMMAETGTNS